MKRMLFVMSGIMLLAFGWWRPTPPAPLAWVYLSPAARQFVSPTTVIALRHGSPIEAGSLAAKLFTVRGSRSGLHAGAPQLSDDQLTVLFYPDQPFAYGETVTVQVAEGIKTQTGQAFAAADFTFAIRADKPVQVYDSLGAWRSTAPSAPTSGLSNHPYHTYPEFNNMMPFTLTAPASGTAPGYVFVAGMSLWMNYDPTLLILDDVGEPLFIQTFPFQTPRQWAADFKKQTVNGQSYLTYHLGNAQTGGTNGRAYVLNPNYTLSSTWNIGNGYEAHGADVHEFLLLDNGHALLLSYVPGPYDLSPYGGSANATVVDMIIQEQDSAHNVVFEWSGLQHVPVTNTYISLTATGAIDYLHTNAIEFDPDGNLLISSRNTIAINKIDRNTGNILWTLGGRSNQFNFNGDPGFWYQHDIRRLANGHITLFDNGNGHNPPASRFLEYAIDETNHVVTNTWQWPNNNSLYSFIMGNAQRLPNGNTLGSWSTVNRVTEVTADGQVAYDLGLADPTYRAFRYTWEGTPAEAPRLATVTAGNPTTATLYFAWNGATDITRYNIYAGPTLSSTTLLTNTLRTGFETSLALTNLPADTCVLQARPIRQLFAGQTPVGGMPFSNPVYRLDVPACRALLNFTYLPIVSR